MLSICIPTYNYEVTDLVTDLHLQCSNAGIDFEILVGEDGSLKVFYEKNKKTLSGLSNVNHIILEENIGRSAMRNMLAASSEFEKLIFIDCDSRIPDENYIRRYLNNYDFNVVCGGTIYIKSQKEKDKTLRYKFGIKREMVDAKKRQKHPNKSFTTNNFMISRKIFDKIKFREFLKKYGHEDSLFGYELMKDSYIIHHIDNPVIHEGIENNEVFLKKSEEGILNLILIQNNDFIDKNFINEINLIRAHKKLSTLKLTIVYNFFFNIFKLYIINHLLRSKNPSIFIFDLYKLGFYNASILKT